MGFGIFTRDSDTLVGEVCGPLTKSHQKRAGGGPVILTERRRKWRWRRTRSSCRRGPLTTRLIKTVAASSHPPDQREEPQKSHKNIHHNVRLLVFRCHRSSKLFLSRLT